MNLNFWNGKKVLITGHTGFKGSWLTVWLKKLGAQIVGLSLTPPSEPNMFTCVRAKDGMVSIQGDIRDLGKVRRTVEEHHPDVVFHMAAQALVRRAYDEPVETYTTNMIGTLNILEALRAAEGVRVAVMITSDKCYENKEWWWGYREVDAMGGADPYSNSKGCAELIISAYRRSFFSNSSASDSTAIASVRAGNVIGGGDWAADRLIPDVIQAFMEGRPVTIRSPDAIRPWQHVLEPLSGYMELAEKLWHDGDRYSDSWNFGPSHEDSKPVAWIVEHLAEIWGGARWVVDRTTQHHEANYLKLDCSKARMCLDWRPRLDIETALKWVVDWYRAYHRGDDLALATAKQIDSYEDLL